MHKIEITVENNRESFQFRGGERRIEWSFIRHGRIREFPRWDRVWSSGNCPAPTDQEIRDHGLRVETRRENDKTKNVIRFRASLSHRRGLNFRNRWTCDVCVMFRFWKKKKKKRTYYKGITFNRIDLGKFIFNFA